MDVHIFIAIIAVVLNLLLATIIPCLIQNSDQPFLSDVKKVYNTNKELILASSIILGLTVYIALKITPTLDLGFTSMTGINIDNNIKPNRYDHNIDYDYNPNDQLKYLIKLRA
jgi:hypothetical protein